MKKKFAYKPLSVILCTALVLCSLGATVFAAKSNSNDSTKTESKTSSSKDSSAQLSKDETVYVLAGADGSVSKIIVSDWIKNAAGKDTINDKSELKNVKNVKGNETYTLNGDNMKVWDAEGNDIYLQGDISKELPVNLSVSYTLDGKSISPSKLAGKSGKLTIRYDYTNNQYQTVNIDGKQEKIYVPFAMLTGMLLDNKVFTNVDVTNGKIINDGSRTAVIGVTFPGLQDNLNIDKQKLDIPSYVEITADVKNFEMTNTITIATNEVFNKIDSGKLNSADDLTNSLTQLTSAMDQLLSGSSQLYGGLCTLLDKSNELIQGVDKLAAGAEKLNLGTGKAADGSNKLSLGLDLLTSKNSELTEGSKKVFEALLKNADSELKKAGLTVPELTINNYASTLDAVVKSLSESEVRKQATAAAKTKVTETVTAEVRKQITGTVVSNFGMTYEQYEQKLKNNEIPAEQKAAIENTVKAQMQTAAVKNQINALVTENMKSADVQNQINKAVNDAKAGAKAVKELNGQLDGYNELYVGIADYTAGVAEADAGAKELNEGIKELKDGINELYNGILTLKNNTPALVSGVTELKNGAMKLNSGLSEFNEKGIKKLTDAVNGDIAGLITRVKATADVSKSYKNFSGISDEMSGQVKFIYRTDSIKNKTEKTKK